MNEQPSCTPFDLEPNELNSLEELLSSSHVVKEFYPVGKLIQARFLSANEREYYFDIGEKEEGICPISEFDKKPNIGEEVTVLLQKRIGDGPTLLSKIEAEKRLGWQDIEEAFSSETNLSGKIKKVFPAGYLIQYRHLELFMPLSQSSFSPISEKQYKVGKEIDFRILELKNKYYSAVVSYRTVVVERNDALWDQFTKEYKVGDMVEGIVVKRVSFGVFLEVQGLIALLHTNDISWKKWPSLKNQFHLKRKLSLKILAIDRENNRINLGLKQLSEEPWVWAKRELKVNQIVKSKVLSITKYGAFLEIREGLEGLLHISELSWERKKRHPKHYLEVGQEIEIKIINLDYDNKRAFFSLKQTSEDPWEELKRNIKVGEILSGKVIHITNFGAFVKINPYFEGLIHQKDYAWQEATKEAPFRKGEKIKYKILEINDETRRIACGYKQLSDSPHQAFQKKYPTGSLFTCKIKRIAPFGLLVDIGEKIEGTIYAGKLGLNQDQNFQEVFQVGEEVQALLQEVNLKKRRIILSIIAYRKKKENDFTKQYIRPKNERIMATPFADLLKEEKRDT